MTMANGCVSVTGVSRNPARQSDKAATGTMNGPAKQSTMAITLGLVQGSAHSEAARQSLSLAEIAQMPKAMSRL